MACWLQTKKATQAGLIKIKNSVSKCTCLPEIKGRDEWGRASGRPGPHGNFYLPFITAAFGFSAWSFSLKTYFFLLIVYIKKKWCHQRMAASYSCLEKCGDTNFIFFLSPFHIPKEDILISPFGSRSHLWLNQLWMRCEAGITVQTWCQGPLYKSTAVVAVGQQRSHCERSLTGIYYPCFHGPNSTRFLFCHIL